MVIPSTPPRLPVPIYLPVVCRYSNQIIVWAKFGGHPTSGGGWRDEPTRVPGTVATMFGVRLVIERCKLAEREKCYLLRAQRGDRIDGAPSHGLPRAERRLLVSCRSPALYYLLGILKPGR